MGDYLWTSVTKGNKVMHAFMFDLNKLNSNMLLMLPFYFTHSCQHKSIMLVLSDKGCQVYVQE